jgi:prephenate dehydratase
VVGFQGEPGAFSEEAALALMGAVTTHGYRSFNDLVEGVERGDVPYGLLPCENTIYGPISQAYDLLGAHPNVRIVDETTHRIEQCLIGLQGADIAGLQRVISHPVALEQCRTFLRAHPHLRVEPADDTAGSVRRIVEGNDPTIGAIGPAFAARRYGAIVLASAIQDDAETYTRFFLIARDARPRRSLGRACVAVGLAHEPGSLHAALGKLGARGMNVRSLLARPSRSRAFEYRFFLEIDAPPEVDVPALAASLSADAQVLGHY